MTPVMDPDPVKNNPRENEAALDQPRAALYRLLGALYLREATPELLDQLHHSGFFIIAADAGIEFPKVESDASNLCRTLETEYARLFIGPGPQAPPYGSVYRSDDGQPGQLWGSTTAEVKRFMEHYGLKTDKPGMIPDHIGILFEFMATVIDEYIQAIEERNSEKIQFAESLQRRFFKEYIHPWVDLFLNRVDQFEPAPFYKATVELTRIFMLQEREQLLPDLKK